MRLRFGLATALSACAGDAAVIEDLPYPMEIAGRTGTLHGGGCIRTSEDELVCWEESQLYPDCERGGPRSPGEVVETGAGAVAVAVGHNTCVVLAGGVKCWGTENEYGAHGQGDTVARGSRYFPAGSLSEIPFIDLGTTSEVRGVVSTDATCALFVDGLVKCWGGGPEGLAGVDSQARGDELGEMGDLLPFVDLGTDAHVVSLDGDGGSLCAVLDDGRLKCWGRNNEHGKLGYGDTQDRRTPEDMGDALPAIDLGSGARAIDVGVGANHVCAVLSDGGVKCWGSAYELEMVNPQGVPPDIMVGMGRLGYGDNRHRGATPVDLGDNLPFVDLGVGIRAAAVDSSDAATCALLTSGKVKCWGSGLSDYAGVPYIPGLPFGDEPGEMGDALAAFDFGDRTVVGLAAAGNSACSVLDDGELVCWGQHAEPECPIVLP